MPDTYLDSSIVGFNHQDGLDAKIDTYKRLAPILDAQDRPAIGPDFANNLSSLQSGTSDKIDAPKIDLGSALVSTDNYVRQAALKALDEQTDQNIQYKYDLGRSIETPVSDYTDKFTGKRFGFSALRDNEDFYYKNQYMQDGQLTRIAKNVPKFLGRVVVPAVLKLGEGFGYVGSMLTSIGSENYWADVADNGLSKWLEGQEQTFKDRVIPIYKQAGFDDKGFFSKLGDGAFWTDSVADGVAFMASAAIPGTVLSKLGTIGAIAGEVNAFGKVFSATNAIGKIASGIGLGSPAQLVSWTFNTAMEASMEGAGVFKEVTKRMKDGRDAGDPEYKNLTDEQIRERAGNMAANTVLGNFAVLALSNAWENKLFFKNAAGIEGRAAVQLGEDFTASSNALNQLNKTGIKAQLDITNPLRRLRFYGEKALEGTIMEGLWEENAQLAIQRMNQGDNEYVGADGKTYQRSFFNQLGKQTRDAFSGNDKEASESIGLGALIGIGGGTVFSKISNERREEIENTKNAVIAANNARNNLFTSNDVYKRDDKNKIVFDAENKPVVDEAKLKAKKDAFGSLYKDVSLVTRDDYFNSPVAQFKVKRSLADYVRSLNNIGINDVSSRLTNLNPENAALFGLDPQNLNSQTSEFRNLASSFETESKKVSKIDMGSRPVDVTPLVFVTKNESRKSDIYKSKTDNIILDTYITDERNKMLAALNQTRTLNNSSLAQFPVDNLNLLISQGIKNKQMMQSVTFKNLSDLEKDYHIQRDAQIREEIKKFKVDNELSLKDSRKLENGFYVPLREDSTGEKVDVTVDKRVTDANSMIANYTEYYNKNSYKDSLFSDKENGYFNYDEWSKTAEAKELEKQLAKSQEEEKKKSEKYRELVPGDFDKVNKLVGKMVFGENQTYSPEELQLQTNYSELIEKMLPDYEGIVENQRIKSLAARLDTLRESNAIISNSVNLAVDRNADNEVAIVILLEELEHIDNQSKVDQKRIADAINAMQTEMVAIDDFLEKKAIQLQNQDNQIQLLEQEIQGGSFKGLYGALEELKAERNWLSNKITDTKSLLDRLTDTVKAIVRFAYKLFGNKSNFAKNLEKGRSEALSYADEISSTTEDRDNAKALLEELTQLDQELRDKYVNDKAEIDKILNDTNNIFKAAYLDLTKASPEKSDAEIDKINAGLLNGFGDSENGNDSPNENEGFDGNAYQRPLSSKFFTSTFPFISSTESGATYKTLAEAPQDVQDYFKFVEFLTNPNNKKAISDKLGNGELKTLIVNKNNVDELGLRDHLKKDQYFNIEDPALTHMEIVPIIEDGGYQYFVDAEMNKLGKVGEPISPKMVSTSLRRTVFTDAEIAQYSVKYTPEQMALALKSGLDWRSSILDLSTKSPKASYDFNVTRGIPNKQILQDGTQARNPVVGTLLPKIEYNSLVVISDNTSKNLIINDEYAVLPSGRPFIRSNNGVHEQYHAADNVKLDSEHTETISLVLNEMIKDHIKKVMDRTVSDKSEEMKKFAEKIKSAGSIDQLSNSDKKKFYLYLTKSKVPLFDSAYTGYLSSILHFGSVQKGKKLGKNQLTFSGASILFGDSGLKVDLTMENDIRKNGEVQKFLSDQFHNVKYFTKEADNKKSFTEYHLKDGKLETRVWANYATYMLSEKNPDGSARTSIPVTTSIKTKEQMDLAKDGIPYSYVSRGITIITGAQPVIKKSAFAKAREANATKSKEPKVSAFAKAKAANAAKIMGTAPKVEEKLEEEVVEDAFTSTEEFEGGLDMSEMTAVKSMGEEENKDEPPAISELPAFRIAKGGVFNTEEDLDNVAKEINRMIPQITFERVKNIIQGINGIQAWGQFVNNTIQVYEQAESGTAWHEVFEAVANKILSDKEWGAVKTEFSKRSGYFTERETGNRIKYSQATDQQVKEELAEEFRDYKMGKVPQAPQAKSFFKIIWDFIRNLFNNKITIASIFDKIDQGKYANTPLAKSNRFASNYRMANLPVEVERDLFDGATAFMFSTLFNRPGSIADIDEIDETDESVYNPIKESFQRAVTNIDLRLKAEKDEFKKKSLATSKGHYEDVLGRWREFVDAHKQEIKKFKIKFGEESVYTDDLEDITNRNDYTSGHFSVSGKASASKSVKFLFGTLLQLKFNKEGKTIEVNGKTAGALSVVENSMFTYALSNYDDYMLRALEEFQGMSDFDSVQKKLEELAGIKEIESMQNPEARIQLIQNMDDTKAVWTSLYQRIFGFNSKIDEESSYKLKVKFHNYITKQSPNPYVTFTNGTVMSSLKRQAYETALRSVQNAITSQQSKIFVRKTDRAGIKTYSAGKEFSKEIDIKEFASKDFAPNRKRFIEFIGMDTYITDDFINSLTDAQNKKINQALFTLRNQLSKTSGVRSFTLKELDIVGYTTNLINLIDRYTPAIDKGSQFMGINNEMRQRHIVPSFISRILAEVDNVSTIEELQAKYPQLSSVFARNSIILNKLFDPETGLRTSVKVPLGYIEGIKDQDEETGTTTAKLEFIDKYYQQFNNTLQGLYHSLPADSETEWIFEFGEFLDYSDNLISNRGVDIVNQLFLPKLKNEIDLINIPSNLLNLNGKHLSAKQKRDGSIRTIGESLRFFKDILPTATVDKIYKDLEDGKTSDKILASKKLGTEIREGILNWINSQVNTTMSFMQSEQLRLMRVDEGVYSLANINNSFLEKNSKSFPSEGGVIYTDEARMKDLIAYQKINSVIAAMESFQVIFGDPAQYKDWEKRAKSLFSPYEQTYNDSTGMFDNWLNTNKNSAVLGDEVVELSDDDILRYNFSNDIKSVTTEDFMVIDTQTANDLQDTMDNGTDSQKEFISKFIDAYQTNSKGEAQINESDGQSIGTLGFARHLMIKSGWRWTKEMENYFQYDNALMRQDFPPQTYTKEAQDLDKKIIAYYKENPPVMVLTPVKTLMPSVTKDGNQVLLKHSIHFMSYQVAKGFQLLDLYREMLTKGEDIRNFRSAQKVGLETNKEGKVSDYYSDPFTKNDLDALETPVQILDMRTIGIQVETQSSSTGQRLGSQSTKLVNLNLFEDGLPSDFELLEGESLSQGKERFNALSEEEKLAISDNYNKVYGKKGSFTTLQNMKEKNALDKFTELGVKWKYSDSGEITYEVGDLSKIKQYIHDELQRLEVDYNTIDNIELTQDKKAFENPAELLPTYTVISNLLWSMADKSITAMKVNGKSLVQVSSAFFNKGSRKAAYKQDGKWVTINSKEEYDQAVLEGKKPVMTSTELNFYRRNPDTGLTEGMEVYLPNIYLKKVNAKRLAKGLPELSGDELMNYLNSDPRLLQGIGFRIPTQATSSLEFFKIKGFLDPAFGNAIVVPSAMTAKGGSDFDVDKLNTYLNNFFLDNKGLPKFEEFKDNSNSSVDERYIAFVNSSRVDYEDLVDDLDAALHYIDTNEKIKENDKAIANTKDMFVIAKDQDKAEYKKGLSLFQGLPLPLKQQYYDTESSLRAMNITGAEKILEYMQYTQNWINAFEGTEALQLEYTSYKDDIKRTEIVDVYSREAIHHLKNMMVNYQVYMDKLGVTAELRQRYFDTKQELREDNDYLRSDIALAIAEKVAGYQGLISSREFEKLPLHLQNSKAALQNEYFSSMRTILQDPKMFEYLLSPNSTGHIISNRDTIYKAKGIVSEEKKELNYTNALSTEYIAQKRFEFTKGKYDIGIFAVGMTNFANSQVTGISISAEGGVKKIDSFVFDTLNDGYINLPFEDIKMQEINGVFTIPISQISDTQGKLVMDKLSAYINGAVDVAKDPIIIQMGMHTELAGVYILMERMGLSGDTTALFMMQPSIREYLNEIIHKNSYYGNPIEISTSKIMKEVAARYLPLDFTYNPNYKLTDKMLADMIAKGERIKNGKKETWTPSENEAQYYAFINYLKMKMLSNNLLEDIQSSNHDTASIRDSAVILRKDLQLKRAKKGNLVNKIENGQVLNGGEVLRNKTSVGTDVKLFKLFDKMLSDIQLFALQRDNPKSTLMSVAEKVFNINPFQTNDDFIKTYRDYQSSMIDSLISKVQIIGTNSKGEELSNALSKYTAKFFKTSTLEEERVNNLKSSFARIKEGYPKLVKSNFFLSNLEINSDPSYGIDLMELKRKPGNSDIYTKKLITEAFEKLANDERKEIRDFYHSIVYGAMIQFGIKFSRKSFVDLMPVSSKINNQIITITDITKAALENIDNEDFSSLPEQVMRSKGHKKNIVPEKRLMGTQILYPSIDKPGKMILSGQQWRSALPGSKGTPSKSSQTFFGKFSKETNRMEPYIHPLMVWAGYESSVTDFKDMPDVISIPAVKPEYLVMRLGSNGNSYKTTSDVVDAMRKRGDHSYLFNQLYMKVGLYDERLARASWTDGSKETAKKAARERSISYLYKPINKWGIRDFNEMYELTQNADGSYSGQQSIISFPPFKEWNDNDLVSIIDDKKLFPVIKAEDIETGFSPLSPVKKPVNSTKKILKTATLSVDAANAIRIASGEKTVMVKSLRQYSEMGIRNGETAPKIIGGNTYNITSRGRLSIEEAGGLQELLKKGAFTTEEAQKYQLVKDWIAGTERLFVYDITPSEAVGDETPPIIPKCGE